MFAKDRNSATFFVCFKQKTIGSSIELLAVLTIFVINSFLTFCAFNNFFLKKKHSLPVTGFLIKFCQAFKNDTTV